ncbi:MAG: ferritin family protein, partial [Thermodesulfovibrionia bacterium]|nr:ferritin family protein [Thermodesulfovibrionia bacterium]
MTLFELADFEKIARDEGFPEVAESFKQIAKVERFHEARYRKLSSNLQANTFFKKKESTKWHCRN